MLNESTWFALWMGVALKSTVLLGAAWLLSLVLRRRSAAVRHLVWTGAAVAVLALPFFSVSQRLHLRQPRSLRLRPPPAGMLQRWMYPRVLAARPPNVQHDGSTGACC
jgi:hypothetical protein